MKIDFIDISRAFVQADAIRDVNVDLPKEDLEPGMCGKLKKCVYGTRDAVQNWRYAYTQLMRDGEFQRCPSSPCIVWHAAREDRCVVHAKTSPC